MPSKRHYDSSNSISEIKDTRFDYNVSNFIDLSVIILGVPNKTVHSYAYNSIF